MDIAVPPGETIKEALEARGMNVTKFASLMRISERHAEGLLDGTRPITISLAVSLEELFDVKASFWFRLEDIYRRKVLHPWVTNA